MKRAQIKRIAKGMYTGPTIDIAIEAKRPTQIGKNIRDAVIPVYERLKAVRHANAEANKAEAFGIALRKG
jgi:citrate lyase gamma subunit